MARMATANGITRVLAPNPSPWTGDGTNSYVVAGETGRCVVIDPASEDEGHLQRLVEIGTAAGGIAAILLTHGHPDHREGAARLAALTGAPLLAATNSDVVGVSATLADGAIIPLGERRLRAIYTPGHRFDHLCFLVEDARILLAGDIVAGVGTVVIAPPEGDLRAYLASLRRLQAMGLRRILPGHGPTIDDPPALLERYIRHRHEREQQVLAGLAGGPRAVDELVIVIYPDLADSLRDAAALSLTAHLLKLESEGRVVRAAGPDRHDRWQRALGPGGPAR